MDKPLALIVEDETDIAIIFAKAAQAAGFETEVVRAGDTAMTWLLAVVPEVVVLDLNLPRVPGGQILQFIREDPRLAGTRVIVATAHQALAENAQVQKLADKVLMKPISPGHLRKTLQQLVEKKDAD